MKKWSFAWVLLVCASLPLAARAQAKPGPSFNCAKAATDAEKAVCADPNLAQFDQSLAKLWKAYLEAFEDDHQHLKALRSDQAAWLAQRNACKADGACIAAAYAKRHELLTGKHAARPFAGVRQSPSGTLAIFPAWTRRIRWPSRAITAR
jgi:uncharacterized protein